MDSRNLSSEILRKRLDALTLDVFLEKPSAMYIKIKDIIVPFDVNVLKDFYQEIETKINLFSKNVPKSNRGEKIKSKLSLLMIMLIERCKTDAEIEAAYRDFHAQYPNSFTGYNYHAHFLMQKCRYTDCVNLLTPVIARNARASNNQSLANTREELERAKALAGSKVVKVKNRYTQSQQTFFLPQAKPAATSCPSVPALQKKS